MRRLALAALLAVSACARPTATPTTAPEAAPARPEPAPPAPPVVPARGDGPALPSADTVLTRIAVGCCPEPGVALPVLAAVAAAAPDLLVLIDRTAGTVGARADAYGRLNLNAQFAAFNMAAPMIAAPGAVLDPADGERTFETYWTGAALGAGRDGVHGGRIFGLPGRRVQILVLSPEPAAAERAWLETELRRAAEVRVIVGPLSVPVSAGGAIVRLATGDGRDAAGVLAPPPLNGPEAGFGMVEIDWPGGRVRLSRRDLNGRILERSSLAF